LGSTSILLFVDRQEIFYFITTSEGHGESTWNLGDFSCGVGAVKEEHPKNCQPEELLGYQLKADQQKDPCWAGQLEFAWTSLRQPIRF